MMRIDRRGAVRGAARSSKGRHAARAIEGKSGFGLARELTARVVLGHDLDITALSCPISPFDVQPKVRQLKVAVHNWEGPGLREGLTIGLDGGVVRTVG